MEIKLDHRNYHDFYKWASTQENQSSGFPTMQDSNQPAQLQKLARMLKFLFLCVSSLSIILFRERTTKGLIRLCRYGYFMFSLNTAHKRVIEYM